MGVAHLRWNIDWLLKLTQSQIPLGSSPGRYHLRVLVLVMLLSRMHSLDLRYLRYSNLRNGWLPFSSDFVCWGVFVLSLHWIVVNIHPLWLPYSSAISKAHQATWILTLIQSGLLSSSHSLPYYLSCLSQHLGMVWEVPVADFDLIYWIVVISTLSQVLAHLGDLRKGLVVEAVVHGVQAKTWAFCASCSLANNNSSPVAPILRAYSSLKPELAQIA